MLDPTIEKRRTDRQLTLDAQRSGLERNQLGQFATPPGLADEIVKAVLTLVPTDQQLRFLEPAVGSGAFFSALIRHQQNRKIATALGVEIDERFASLAHDLWADSGLKILPGDFLAIDPIVGGANMLIANPPYVRHHHIDAVRKKELQQTVSNQLGIKISGLAGLYCYFVLLADRWLAEDAISAWLIPAEFMDVNYGQALRDYLTKHVTLLQIHRYSSTEDKFDDALVSSAVVVFQKRKPNLEAETQLSFGGSMESPSRMTRITTENLQRETRWTRLARPSVQQRSKESLRGRTESLSLGDLFAVKRGIATGANKFFMLPKSQAQEIGLPAEVLKPILPSPRHIRNETIERADDGYPDIHRQLSLLDCGLPADRVMRDFPSLWSYLAKGKAEGVPAGYLVSRRKPWYSQEQRLPAPYLCSYMGRSETRPFRFFWNKSDAIAPNVYLMLYPKPQLAAAIAASTTLAGELFEMFTQISSEDFFDEGRVYGGGLFKLEPAELKRLPVKGFPSFSHH
jgi:hypothetical protein